MNLVLCEAERLQQRSKEIAGRELGAIAEQYDEG
jgi:hypothetical protein